MGITIELPDPNRIYSPGEVVEGRVIVKVAQQENMKEIVVYLLGMGQVNWSEDRGKHTSYFSSKEQHVAYKSSVAGDGESKTILPAGITVYPFRIQLPNGVPSTFTHHIGQVSYQVRAEVKRFSLKGNYVTQIPFRVEGRFDLNLAESARMLQECRKSLGSSCCLGREGELSFAFCLPTKSGFVPGEAIDFQANILNNSNKRITWMKASLNQVLTFYAEGSSKIVINELLEVKGPQVEAGDDELWEGCLNISIDLFPTRLGGSECKIIDIQYHLQLEVNVSGESEPLIGMLPVMIGTIPLRSAYEEVSSQISHAESTGEPQLATLLSQTEPGSGYSLPDVV